VGGVKTVTEITVMQRLGRRKNAHHPLQKNSTRAQKGGGIEAFTHVRLTNRIKKEQPRGTSSGGSTINHQPCVKLAKG